jgi:hypothetical protein
MKAKITSLDPPQATEVREKPQRTDNKYWFNGVYENGHAINIKMNLYKQDLQNYKQSQVPMDIENVFKVSVNYQVIYDENGSRMGVLQLNQPVQIVRTGDKCRITKIN